MIKSVQHGHFAIYKVRSLDPIHKDLLHHDLQACGSFVAEMHGPRTSAERRRKYSPPAQGCECLGRRRSHKKGAHFWVGLMAAAPSRFRELLSLLRRRQLGEDDQVTEGSNGYDIAVIERRLEGTRGLVSNRPIPEEMGMAVDGYLGNGEC
jgi:hypothetical protein